MDLSKVKSNFSKHVLSHNHDSANIDILINENKQYLVDNLERLFILSYNEFHKDRLINEQVKFPNHFLHNVIQYQKEWFRSITKI